MYEMECLRLMMYLGALSTGNDDNDDEEQPG